MEFEETKYWVLTIPSRYEVWDFTNEELARDAAEFFNAKEDSFIFPTYQAYASDNNDTEIIKRFKANNFKPEKYYD